MKCLKGFICPSIGGSPFGMIDLHRFIIYKNLTVEPMSACDSPCAPAEVNPLTDLGMMTMMTMKAPLVGQGLRS